VLPLLRLLLLLRALAMEQLPYCRMYMPRSAARDMLCTFTFFESLRCYLLCWLPSCYVRLLGLRAVHLSHLLAQREAAYTDVHRAFAPCCLAELLNWLCDRWAASARHKRLANCILHQNGQHRQIHATTLFSEAYSTSPRSACARR
jgi:hypothetical protein